MTSLRFAFVFSIILAALAGLATAQEPAAAGTDEFVQRLVGRPAGPTLAGEALDQRTEEVSHSLRCPVCQGSSVGDSPSSTARAMKAQVRELLGNGYSEGQVFSYFEASYGEFVRLAPKSDGIGAVVWVLPLALALLGVYAAIAWLRSRRTNASTSPARPAHATPAGDADLDPYLARIRGETR